MISVVTPSFNHADFIEQTIKSVLGQNDIFEYIIVDGNSTDDSINIINNWRYNLSKIIIEDDNGQADALAKGFSFITGDICAYINSDDVYLPDIFNFVTTYFRDNPDVDFIYGHRIFIDEQGKAIGVWILPPHSNYLTSRWDFIPQETCFWRRKLMEECGGIDTSYQFAMDYDLFVRMMKKGRFVRLNKFFALFRVHPKSKTSTLLETIGEQEIIRVRDSENININIVDKIIGKVYVVAIYLSSTIFWFFAKRFISAFSPSSRCRDY